MKTTKTTTLALATLAVLGVSVTLWATSTAHRPSVTYPSVTYGSRCGPAGTGTTWVSGTGGATTGVESLTIEQTEVSHNVWLPSAKPIYYTEADEGCRFECAEGYELDDGQECVSSGPALGVSHDEVAGTITVSDGTQFYTIMDRNLGATVAGTGKLYNGWAGGTCTNYGNGGDCWDPSYWDYFQWGNNTPFPNSGTILLSGTTRPDASGFGPGNYYNSGYYVKAGSDWSNPGNNNLRGGSGDTQSNWAGKDADRQGPCPAGYHVPSAYEWGGLLQTWYNVNSGAIGGTLQNAWAGLPYISTGTVGEMFRNDFLIPLAGYRSYDSSATVFYQGYYALYWSSSPYSTNARYLYFNPSYVYSNDYDNRAYAFSLRCFQNSVSS